VDPRVAIFWGDEDGGTSEDAWDHRIDIGTIGEESYSTDLSGLTPGKTYYFRCHARNPIGSAWSGETRTFVPCEFRAVFKPGDSWKYFPGRTNPGKDWPGTGHDDGSWREGPSGFGYGDGDDATELGDMRGEYLVLYLRMTFPVRDPSRVQSLIFTVDYDDGFVAFINGREVARRNVKKDQDYRTAASDNHEAGKPETIDLSGHIPLLLQGKNVFAIEVHNREMNSSDLSMIPALNMAGGQPERETRSY
jgi:hypothetical protein